MVDHHRPDGRPHDGGNGRVEHPDVRFEPTDVGFRAGLVVVAVALVAAVVIHGAVLWYFYAYRGHEDAIKRSPYPLAPTPSTVLPPEPRLEQLDIVNGVPDVTASERRATREAELDRYGPSPEKGYVRVPIDVAIKHLAGKLPARKGSPADAHKANGLVDAGESNSGRMFRGEARWYER